MPRRKNFKRKGENKERGYGNPTGYRHACKYKCGSCGEMHDESYQAEECCVPSVEEVDGWACKACGEWYEDEDDAEDCCKKKED